MYRALFQGTYVIEYIPFSSPCPPFVGLILAAYGTSRRKTEQPIRNLLFDFKDGAAGKERESSTYFPLLSPADGPKPQRSRMRCRNRSRSSGGMFAQRSAMRSAMRSSMRRRTLERPEPCHPNPPKRIRHSSRSPSACQKAIGRQPKSGGSSQFHRCSTISPPMVIKSSIPRIASGPMKINLFNLGLIFSPSPFRQFVIDALQSLAQIKHRIAFAREQRIHAHAGRGAQLLEATSFQPVRDTHLAMLVRQAVDRQFTFTSY